MAAKKQITKEKVKLITPQQLIGLHEQNVTKSLQAYGLTQHLTVHFPDKSKTPLIGRLGVWLVNKAGGIIATKYGFANDTINSNSRPKK